MLRSNVAMCAAVMAMLAACNHENDRAMTPANGTTNEPSSTGTGSTYDNSSSSSPGPGSTGTGSKHDQSGRYGPQ